MRPTTTINGRLVLAKDARISVFDNSLMYAEGLFETILIVDNKPMFLDQHLDRLEKGAGVLGLTLSTDRRQLTRWILKTSKAHKARIQKLRITVTSGESARWVGRQGKQKVIMSVAEHKLPLKPFELYVSPLRVDQESVFRQVKTISYAINAAAYKQAADRGLDDALLLNQLDEIAEVTSANLFWVENGSIFTPPLAAGCLEGVTRKAVLQESVALGLSIEHRPCKLTDLEMAEEVFITSSLKLAAPVSRIVVGRRVLKFSPGPITALIDQHLRKMAGL